jgi:osmotically-inducible protein OsmY
MMNRATRSTWRRMSWSLATAGSLGLAGAIHAQSPYAPLEVPGATSAARLRSYEEQLNRATEISTELAWLANASMFPYRLEAHVMGSALQVTGSLPTQALRLQALRIAREESGMPVLDNIGVYSNLVAPPVSKPAAVLSKEVNNALARALPDGIGKITIKIWMGGQVAITGKVATLEDKLTASRCLQRVVGCNCVINQLEVERPIRAVAASRAKSTPRSTRVSAAQSTPARADQVNLLPPTALPVDAQPAVPFLNTVPQTAESSADRQKSLWSPAKATTAPHKDDIALAAAQLPTQPADIGKSDTGPNSEPSSAAEHANSSPAMYHPTKWRRLDSIRGFWSAKPVAGPAAEPVKSVAGSPGIVLISDNEPEAPVAAPANLAVSSPAASGPKPAPVVPPQMPVSEGMIIFDDSEKTTAPETTPNSHALQKRLQELIAATCHKSLEDVEVIVSSPGQLDVHVKARQADECEPLAKRIFQLPELSAFQVSLEIPVAQ